MTGDFLHFLLPSVSSGLELTFFTLIIGSLLASLISAEILGREATWQRNWQGSSQKGALDLEHGSISELSHALASLPERIVGNMPGLLLIFGLLGTFLGLGMALDKASGVLQGSGESLNAMSDSLAQLTGMMKDLGSKFKTSTWGIIAFIALKLWEASRWSADSRRADWCVRQMKREMDLSRQELRAYSERRDLQSREAMAQVGERMVQGMKQQSMVLVEEFHKLMGQQVKLARDAHEHAELHNKRLLTLASAGNRLLTSLEQRSEASVDHLEELRRQQLQHTGFVRQQHEQLASHLAAVVGQAQRGNHLLTRLEQHAEASSGQFNELKQIHQQLSDLTQLRDEQLAEHISEFISQIRESNLSLASLDQRSESVARQLDGLLQGAADIRQRLDALNASSASQEAHLETTCEAIAGVHGTLAQLRSPVRRPVRHEPTEPA